MDILKNNEGNERSREQWIELRTATDRIEGVIFLPAGSKNRRIGDFILEADRGQCGMLHLAHATVFDLATNRIKFRKNNLGINKSMVLYAAPLSSYQNDPKRLVEPTLSGLNAN